MTIGDVSTGDMYGEYYRRRQWNGGDGPHSVEHPYAYSVLEKTMPPVEYRYFQSGAWYAGSMQTFAPAMPRVWTDYTTPLVNKCTMKVWDKLTQSSFNAGVFCGEFRESYHMICDMVHGLARAVALLKKKDYDRALNTLLGIRRPKGSLIDGSMDVAADHFMVWHFGILPLLSDLKGLLDWMQRSYQVVKRVKCASTYKEESGYPYSFGVVWDWHLKAVAEIRGEVRMTQLTEYDCLGLTDPYSVAWEITKLSWMVDWALPIGNFLAAVNAHNKTYGDVFYVTRNQCEWIDHPYQTDSSFIEIRKFDGRSKYFVAGPGPQCGRVPMQGLPWTFPTIQNPLGDHLSRWITSFAFLRQVTR